jgi:hypothetical protein
VRRKLHGCGNKISSNIKLRRYIFEWGYDFMEEGFSSKFIHILNSEVIRSKFLKSCIDNIHRVMREVLTEKSSI